MHVKTGAKASDDVAEIVNRLPFRQAIIRLQLMILKALRIAYLMTVKPLASGQ
jgi:hypothetical protein